MIHYRLKYSTFGMWLVVYKQLCRNPITKEYYEIDIIAGEASTYKGAEALKNQLTKDSRERMQKAHTEMKLLNRDYNGKI